MSSRAHAQSRFPTEAAIQQELQALVVEHARQPSIQVRAGFGFYRDRCARRPSLHR